MNLCSDNHDEICHEGRSCPLCNEISKYEKNVEERDEKIKDLEKQIADNS